VSGLRALLLAAGLGTRLRSMTDECPKCLVPISGRPLLEHWLCNLYRCDIDQVIINLHHHRQLVETFLARAQFSGWVQGVVEDDLLGTAGTLRANAKYFSSGTMLLAHADNWCQCSFPDFFNFHKHHRPPNTVMTMMTFRTPDPKASGIVELDADGVVHNLHEKVSDPPGDLANGAVYLLEPDVLRWVERRPQVYDFSTELLPEFLGRIATWENHGIHRDIGTVTSLLDAQHDPKQDHCWRDTDEWMQAYQKNPIHNQLNAIRIQS
jgi:mannose-1-phosphate guanylyltransferase